MKKALIIIIPIILIAAGIGIYRLTDKRVSAQYWLASQYEYLYPAEELADSLDDVVTMYINGNLDMDGYYTQMTTIYDEMSILLQSYEEGEKENAIITGTHNDNTKAGTKAVKDGLNELSKLVNDCMTDYENKEKLAYTYLAYIQSINGYFETYINAYNNEFEEDIEEELNLLEDDDDTEESETEELENE